MNRRAAKRITADTREEFDELRKDLGHHFGADTDVDQERRLLVEHARAMVAARTQRLLDTLLNYLMEDAMAALADAPTAIKNEFYGLDLRSRVKQSFTPDPDFLKLSSDPRLIAGKLAAGGTAVAGGLMTLLFLSGLITRIAGGAATLVVSAIAFRIAHSATTGTALQWLRNDVDAYVTQSEQQVSAWLANVEDFFVSAFKEFQDSGEQAKEETA